MSAISASKLHLSESLEDYLETIFELVRAHKVARIKDIAAARDVRSASVIPAMRRLSEMGLISYEKREFIDLTPQGEAVARRIYSRHRMLTGFFRDVIGIPDEFAQLDACSLEHHLTNEGMDHIVRFLEFVQSCPEGKTIVQRFQNCALVNGNSPECLGGCPSSDPQQPSKLRDLRSLSALRPGEASRVIRIEGAGAVRQRMIDMGILPGVRIFMERISPAGDPIWIRIQGSQISLRKKEALRVLVEVEPEIDS